MMMIDPPVKPTVTVEIAVMTNNDKVLCVCRNPKCNKMFEVTVGENAQGAGFFCSQECGEQVLSPNRVMRTCRCGCGRMFELGKEIGRKYFEQKCSLVHTIAKSLTGNKIDQIPDDILVGIAEQKLEEVTVPNDQCIMSALPSSDVHVEQDEEVTAPITVVEPEEPEEVVPEAFQSEPMSPKVKPERKKKKEELPPVVVVSKEEEDEDEKPFKVKQFSRPILPVREMEGVEDDFACVFDPNEPVYFFNR